jgi:hypothetical protein
MTFNRRVTLNAADLPPPPTVFEVPLTLKIEIDGPVPDYVTVESLRRMLTQDTYMDGRLAFDVELADHALAMSAAKALRDVVYGAMSKQYGNEVIEHEDGSATGRAYLESEKVLETIKVDRWATRLIRDK